MSIRIIYEFQCDAKECDTKLISTIRQYHLHAPEYRPGLPEGWWPGAYDQIFCPKHELTVSEVKQEAINK